MKRFQRYRILKTMSRGRDQFPSEQAQPISAGGNFKPGRRIKWRIDYSDLPKPRTSIAEMLHLEGRKLDPDARHMITVLDEFQRCAGFKRKLRFSEKDNAILTNLNLINRPRQRRERNSGQAFKAA